MVSDFVLSWLLWLTPVQGLAFGTGLDTGQDSPAFRNITIRAGRSGNPSSNLLSPASTIRTVSSGTPAHLEASARNSPRDITYAGLGKPSSAVYRTTVTRTIIEIVTSPVSTECCPSQVHVTVTKWVVVDTPESTSRPPLYPTSSGFAKTLPLPSASSHTIPDLPTIMPAKDIFAEPIDTRSPPRQIPVRNDHPVPRKGITQQTPLQTNKFYSNFFLEDQKCPAFTYPYSVAWAGGKGATASFGMACSHTEASQRVFGQEKYNGSSSYYVNPIGIQSIVISAKELGKDTALSIDSMTAFSARVHLSKDSSSPPAISFPLVQGMAYVTGQFNGATPVIRSGVFFKTMTRVTQDPKPDIAKYTFTLEDGSTWRVYAYKTKGDPLELKVVNNGLAEAKKPFFGVIQVCKDPNTDGSEALLDDGAGIFPVTLKLSGSVDGSEARYSFEFEKDGHSSGELYMFALPHHVESFDEGTKKQIQKLQLQSQTKGLAALVKGTSWTMVEPELPTNMSFAPWDSKKGSLDRLSDQAKGTIRAAAAKEVTQNMIAQSNLDSMYFSGKVSQCFPRSWRCS